MVFAQQSVSDKQMIQGTQHSKCMFMHFSDNSGKYVNLTAIHCSFLFE